MARLDRVIVEGILRLHRRNFSVAFIARHFQVKRDTVYSVVADGGESALARCDHARCKGCGGLQTDPCQVCDARAVARVRRLRAKGRPSDVIYLLEVDKHPGISKKRLQEIISPREQLPLFQLI